MPKLHETIFKKYNLTPDYTSSVDASDQHSFNDLDIPTIFYFDGKNQDLHTPNDTPTKIDYHRMEKITQLAFETIWRNAHVSYHEKK